MRLAIAAGLCAVTLAAAPAAGQPRRVVVLGSSTAAGAGPSSPDSAWVARYRSYALDLDAANEVVNLALGGFTTYHVLPTGQAPPPNRPTPDPARNITAALALDPDAIVVNLPSNDAALGYSVAEQLANYDTLRSVAGDVPLWLTTPQPRNLPPAGLLLLRTMLDSTLARYTPGVIDFWRGLARPDGTIEPIYNSGDGVHLNSAAHRILFERVVDARVLGETPTDGPTAPARSTATLAVMPNPAWSHAAAVMMIPSDTDVTLVLVDLLGRVVSHIASGPLRAGRHELTLQLPSVSGVFAVRARAEGWTVVTTVVVMPR